VMAPMGIGSYNEDETITDEYIGFIRARSKGTGLIISTGTRVSDKFGGLKVNGIYDDKFIPGLVKLVKAAKNNGSAFFLQLLSFGAADPIDPYAPSVNIPEYEAMEESSRPKELKIDQVKELVEAFAQSARRAKEAGCDGVELFGSEDALIASFICPHFNRRQDRYGKGIEGRMRFPLEIISRIRELCGKEFPIGFKYNTLWDIEDGIDRDLSIRIAKILSDAEVDYIHEWSFESWEKPMSMFKVSPMPSLYQPRNSTISIAHMLKKAVETPIIAVGGILKPEEADKMIRDEKTDMVAMGRAFIADELWAYHATANNDIRPCIRCHVCHNEVAMLEKVVKCSVNPDVLSNKKLSITGDPKRVFIAGGGPAGIITAVYASKRGHKVSLYEQDKVLGGKLIAGSQPIFKYEFKDFLNYLNESINNTDVEINIGSIVDKEMVLKEKPDILIVCIGAEPRFPSLDIFGHTKTFEAVYALRNAKLFKGQKLLFIGGGDVGCETALYLKMMGSDATIVEIQDKLMMDESIEHNSQVLEMMIKKEKINIFLNSQVKKIENGIAFIDDQKTGERNEVKIDSVVFSTGYASNTEKINTLISSTTNSHIIGDCYKPGRLVDAIGQGFEIALKI
ncbi:FAD-dependent oxidoreductase, partial [Actinomycetota bacterium]